jgi:hypothetical protein
MKKTVKLVVFVVLVALFGFGLAMCDPVLSTGFGDDKPIEYCPKDKLCSSGATCSRASECTYTNQYKYDHWSGLKPGCDCKNKVP